MHRDSLASDINGARYFDRVLYVRAHRELRYETVRAALEIASADAVAVADLVSEQKRPWSAIDEWLSEGKGEVQHCLHSAVLLLASLD